MVFSVFCSEDGGLKRFLECLVSSENRRISMLHQLEYLKSVQVERCFQFLNLDVWDTRLGTNISHLGIIFPATFKGDMLVPWMVSLFTKTMVIQRYGSKRGYFFMPLLAVKQTEHGLLPNLRLSAISFTISPSSSLLLCNLIVRHVLFGQS